MVKIGKKIRELRGKLEISQDKLSKLSDLCINTVVKLESDKNPNPTIETLNKIAKALEVKVEDLIN
jgi:transcriptional regulator with XRE-family HTH domain